MYRRDLLTLSLIVVAHIYVYMYWSHVKNDWRLKLNTDSPNAIGCKSTAARRPTHKATCVPFDNARGSATARDCKTDKGHM